MYDINFYRKTHGLFKGIENHVNNLDKSEIIEELKRSRVNNGKRQIFLSRRSDKVWIN